MSSQGSRPPADEDPHALAVVARALADQRSEQREMVRVLSSVEASVGELGAYLQELVTRVEGAEAASETVLRDVAERLAGMGAALAGRDRAMTDLVTGAQEQLVAEAGRVAQEHQGLARETGAAADGLRTVLDLAAARQEEGLAVLHDAAEAMGKHSRAATDILAGVSDAVAGPLSDRVEDATRLVREEVAATLASATDEIARALEGAREDVVAVVTQTRSQLTDSVDSTQVALRDALADQEGRVNAGAEGAVLALTELADRSGEDVATLLQGARNGIAAVVEQARADLVGDLTAVRAGLDEDLETLHGRAAELERVAVASHDVLATLTSGVDAAAAQVRSTFDRAAQSAHDALSEAASRAADGAVEATAALAEVTERLARAEAATQERVEEERLAAEALREELRGDAAEIFRDLRSDVITLLTEIGDRTGQVLDGQAEAEAALRDTLTQEVQVRLGEVNDGVDHILGRISEETRAVAGEQGAQMRDELADAVSELRRTSGQLADALTGVEELRVELVGYLTERDRALERDRMQLMVDILDELGEGMQRKEARRLAGQAAEARDRTRDRRDADRFRELAAQGRILPAAPGSAREDDVPRAAPPGSTP